MFTIGPHDSPEALAKYAVLLTGNEDGGVPSGGVIPFAQGRPHVEELVRGILEGEIRMIVSNMTMDELFAEREMFREKVIKNIQSELDQFGLKIYNANVKELRDCAGQDYFVQLGRRAHEGAINQAKVDVAEAKMKGRLGEAEREGKTKQEIAVIDARVAVLATERQMEKAEADAKLADKQISIENDLNLSKIKAKWQAEERDAELQKIVQLKRAEMQLERQRADEVTKAVIARESEQQRADAKQYSAEKAAAAALYQAVKDAEGTKARQMANADGTTYELLQRAEANRAAKKLQADAEFYSEKQRADAAFYSQQQEALGMVEMAKGYSAMANALGGPQGLMQYLMLRDNTYEKLAKANAQAINGLQPKINVWNTGVQGGDASADATAPIRNLFQSLPPLLSTINDQTGMKPPGWLVQMPQDPEPAPEDKMRAMKDKARKLTNGTSERYPEAIGR